MVVVDVNDHQPTFNQKFLKILLLDHKFCKYLPLIWIVMRIVKYTTWYIVSKVIRMSSSTFSPPCSGILYINKELSFENQSSSELIIIAQDNGIQRLQSTAIVSVTAIKVNVNVCAPMHIFTCMWMPMFMFILMHFCYWLKTKGCHSRCLPSLVASCSTRYGILWCCWWRRVLVPCQLSGIEWQHSPTTILFILLCQSNGYLIVYVLCIITVFHNICRIRMFDLLKLRLLWYILKTYCWNCNYSTLTT